MLSTRQIKILRRLLNNGNAEYGKSIAKAFSVTTRTIRNDINELNSYLNPKKTTIHANPRLGYWIEIEDKKTLSSNLYKVDKQKVSYPETAAQREIYIYFRLLFSNGPVSMNDIANEIFVSKTTIAQDVDNIKYLIECIKDVKLDISKKDGLKIIGPEHQIRKLIAAVILYYYDLNAEFLTYSIHAFSNDAIHTLYHVLIGSFEAQNIALLQRSMKMLCMEIAMYIERKVAGYEVNYMPYGNIKPEYVLPINEINNIFHTKLTDYDLDIIYETMKIKKFISTEEEISYENKLHNDVIQKYLYIIKNKYKIDLFDETKIISHLKKTLATSDIALNRKEIDISDIHEENPVAYLLAKEVTLVFQKELNYTPSQYEIDRLALRLATILDKYLKPIDVLITSGSMTYSEYLLYTLKRYFSKTMNIISACQLYQISDMCSKHHVDLIISTIPLEEISGVDTIYISVIPQPSHILMINQYIAKKQLNQEKIYHIEN